MNQQQRHSTGVDGLDAHLGGGLLPGTFEAASAHTVDSTFGTGFSKILDTLSTGEWQEPVESGLGLHLVRVQSRVEGTLPELADIRPIVEREWANEKRLETRKLVNEQLVENYDIVIEWPAE